MATKAERTRQFLIAMRGTTDKGRTIEANIYFPLDGPICAESLESIKSHWANEADKAGIVLPVASITIIALIHLEA